VDRDDPQTSPDPRVGALRPLTVAEISDIIGSVLAGLAAGPTGLGDIRTAIHWWSSPEAEAILNHIKEGGFCLEPIRSPGELQ
jgi:hypothetical protein